MDYPGKVITKTQVTPTQTSASGNWTLDDQAAAIKNNNWPIAGVPNPISKSLRFNSADSAYLNRTPASAGNRKTWTWSGWVKRSALGAIQFIFGAYDNSSASNSTYTGIGFGSTDTLSVAGWSAAWRTTTQVFRDTSAWYHIVVALDTTQATANNRVKVYVNGVEITAFGTTNNPTQNDDLGINATNQHRLGSINYSSPYYFSGYMTEVNFIDGQALTPSDFGLTNPQTGQWIPKKYTGTYGTNGFYLNFKDATSTTTLGLDYSGNANNWTTNNFSVTAGSGNDSLTDVPTPWVAYNTTGDVGGVVRGNYATLNPLYKGYGVYTAASTTLTNGNLDQTGNGSGNNCVGTQALVGKVYFEITPTAVGAGSFFSGIINESGSPRFYENTGTYYNGSSSSAYGASFTTNDVIGLAVDVDALSLTFYKNGVSQGTKTSAFPAGTWFPWFYTSNASALTANFGQRPFAYTPPAGFRSLCTTNLPATTIGFGLTNQGDDYFDVTLYSGNATARSITNSGSMQPDFVWIKSRTDATNHTLFDSVRGTTKVLVSNLTNAESTDATSLTAFNSNGFSIGTSSNVNFGTNTYVAWQWRAAGSTVTNTAGTITSTVSANTTAGFSIVTYTGTGANATVGHGLGVAPGMVILKDRGSVNSWYVWHSSLTGSQCLLLNLTNAVASSSTFWNSTIPSSTVFSLGTDSGPNRSTGTYVAYCFAAVAGYSAFGSYNGNGSTDGPFVYLGFRPAFVLWKRSNGAESWWINDTDRLGYNGDNRALFPNASSTENTANNIDILSNGFKIRGSGGEVNASGGTYIYACFAESPFQFANAR